MKISRLRYRRLQSQSQVNEMIVQDLETLLRQSGANVPSRADLVPVIQELLEERASSLSGTPRTALPDQETALPDEGLPALGGPEEEPDLCLSGFDETDRILPGPGAGVMDASSIQRKLEARIARAEVEGVRYAPSGGGGLGASRPGQAKLPVAEQRAILERALGRSFAPPSSTNPVPKPR